MEGVIADQAVKLSLKMDRTGSSGRDGEQIMGIRWEAIGAGGDEMEGDRRRTQVSARCNGAHVSGLMRSNGV